MSARLLVTTDLDGCLLDAHDYSWEPAREALAALRAAGAGLVLASSKTRAEMEALSEELGAVLSVTALLVENGGAVLRPGHDPIVLGVARERLVAALDGMARAVGARVRAFHALTAADVAALTGLAPDAAERALRREYDEPFVLEDADAAGATAAALAAAAAERGLALTRGGRFFHLAGPHDKGRALRVLLERERAEGRPATTLALGDAPNDLALLRAADRAVVVPRDDGHVDAELAAALPDAERAPRPGPRGWSEAVLTVLRGGRLARARDAEAAGASR
jgi:mannosyl-3-phosphoglycerate phosphatase